MSTGTFPWLKGHGTENDFVLLPDPDGSLHGDLDPAVVRFLCDRYAGIGADGVLRVIEGSKQSYVEDGGDWFMDYRNADGSIAEMCGNGIRVFARYLAEAGLTDGKPVRVGTRAGVKEIALNDDGTITVDMGEPAFPGPAGIVVEANGHQWPALHVDMGNPHAVAFVDELREPGWLIEQPGWTPVEAFPHGVNVEFVVRKGPNEVEMRVHERGSGETRSCGTGTCAVAVASARAARQETPVTYRVAVPGGSVTVTWREDNHLELTGPAVVHARGEFDRAWLPL
ncbi:diaminopimelate epimerase [Kribbella sp. VKM Ac-2568]|uniref:diaminopimelate epimerase n=1 Tax=Kribbella sp. VKM Ac-2568 TaxID=2512219 RepID=UPI00104ED45C|nr:diaminopimelate epimerase [Kribbella sp. VKM Ac-2568]TCM41217.1 diaminopimelate epimerase [Kribbella sp. VKM Ac-2568]